MSDPGKFARAEMSLRRGQLRDHSSQFSTPTVTSGKPPVLQNRASAVDVTQEIEEEATGAESQEMDRIVGDIKREARSSEEKAKRFQDQMKKDKKRYRDHLAKKVNQAAEKDAHFRKELKSFLPSPPQRNTADNDQVRQINKYFAPVATRADDHPLFRTADLLISNSELVIKHYDHLCHAAEAHNQATDEEVTTEWRRDKEEVLRMLENGKRLSMDRIRRVLPVEKKATRSELTSESWYSETSAYFTGRAQDKRLENTLNQAAKGVRRMVRELPEREI